MSSGGEESLTLRWVKWYIANRSWKLTPINVITNGRCSCSNSSCPPDHWGKHPVMSKWNQEVNLLGPRTPDLEVELERWFGRSLVYSVGLATGAINDVFVLDVDPRNGGMKSLEELERELQPLPDTLTAATGGGGLHFFYKYPDVSKGFRLTGSPLDHTGQLQGIDIKTDGGQVVISPSRHRSGLAYGWKSIGGASEGATTPIAELPDELMDALCKLQARSAAQAGVGGAGGRIDVTAELRSEEPILEGGRDNWLHAVACAIARGNERILRDEGGIGVGWSMTLAAVQVLNERRCRPPLPDSEVEKKTRGAVQLILDTPAVDVYSDEALAPFIAARAGVTGEGETGETGAGGPVEAGVGEGGGDLPDAAWDETVGSGGEGSGSGGASASASGRAARPPKDYGNALRVLDRYPDRFRHHEAFGWMRYNGYKWVTASDDEVRDLVRIVLNGIFAEAQAVRDSGGSDAVADALEKWGKVCQDSPRVGNAMREFRALPQVKVTSEHGSTDVTMWDADPWLLNCKNGTINLRSGSREFRSHAPGDLLTKSVACDWNPLAECPTWLAFLERVIPEQDVREYVQRAIGYALTGVIRDKAFFVMHGDGENGKSVFTENLLEILGDYGLKSARTAFINAPGSDGAHSTDIASLRGIRYVLSSEAEEGESLNSGRIKEATGGDRMNARFMRMDGFTFTFIGKLFIATNKVPNVKDIADEALWRRLKLIPFEVKIEDDERKIPRDVLDDALQAEAEGILRWAVQGCFEWQRHGLNEPAAIMLATATEKAQQDWFDDWVSERCEVGAEVGEARTLFAELYRNYSDWCDSRNDKFVVSANRFGRILTKRGFAQILGANGVKARRGIRVRVLNKYGL